MSEHITEIQSGGLKCDNPECDWADMTISESDYPKWLNAPCPKCGQNVLTDQDYENVKTVRAAIEFINSLSEEQLAEMSDLVPDDIKEQMSGFDKIRFKVETHDKISIKPVENTDEIKKAIDKTE